MHAASWEYYSITYDIPFFGVVKSIYPSLPHTENVAISIKIDWNLAHKQCHSHAPFFTGVNISNDKGSAAITRTSEDSFNQWPVLNLINPISMYLTIMRLQPTYTLYYANYYIACVELTSKSPYFR